MFRYYLWLGLKSLRGSPLLSLLAVLILAIGIAASMTSLTVLYVMSADPLPGRSQHLYVPQFDNRTVNRGDDDSADPQLSWIDTEQLLQDGRGRRRTALYSVSMALQPPRADMDRSYERGMAATADFFAMFDVPMARGSAWSEQDDLQGHDVTVLSAPMAQRLFGDEDPIGRRVRLQDRDYRVVGVLGDWQPLPKVYRLLGSSPIGEVEPYWIPLRNAVTRELQNSGWVNCHGDTEPGWANFLRAECNWLQYWVELAPDEVAGYRSYLQAHVDEQRRRGRMPFGQAAGLIAMPQWLQERGLVPDDTKLQFGLSLAFFAACLVNVVGLLGAKFAARAGEIGVRRALGASRRQLFWQFLVESGVVGAAGALLGLLLSLGGLALLGRRSDDMARVAQMDLTLLALTVLLSLAGALLAGLWPTWRASGVRPALQLKSQ